MQFTNLSLWLKKIILCLKIPFVFLEKRDFSSRKILTLVLVFFTAVTILCIYDYHYANATSNAFYYTKHGGGTTDGLTPCAGGVNRGLGGEYGPFDCNTAASPYDSSNPEAGIYQSGECTHCHEPMASFGGGEAPPNIGGDVGPDPYLLMKEYGTSLDYAYLCWYCHENIGNVNSSGSPLGMGRWSFYQGKTIFMDSSHFQNTRFYWPGTGETSGTTPKLIWPRSDRSALPVGNKGSCLNCHTPHGIKGTSSSPYDTTSPDGSGGVPVDRQIVNCSVPPCNPSVNADYLIPRQLIAWEETLCEKCHDSTGPSTRNIQSEINKSLTSPGTGHPVDSTVLAGRHVVNEALPITKKHVECYDCHNPHAVKPGANKALYDEGGRVKGMKYIAIDGNVCNPVSTTGNPSACTNIPSASGVSAGTRISAQPFIYEICFKCHGNSYAQVFTGSDNNDRNFPGTGPGQAPNRNETSYPKHFSNKRKEFDPTSTNPTVFPGFTYNSSYHPVAAPGRNGYIRLCDQLKKAFNLSCASAASAAVELANITIQCTDCHNSDAYGATDGLANNTFITPKGPVTRSNLRPTDKASSVAVTTPVGPHGSTRKKLLRGNYLMANSTSGDYGRNWYISNRMDSNGRPKFELCFLCHEEAVLISDTGTGFGGGADTGNKAGWDWGQNLHRYHLNVRAICHDCHANVHSNIEAQNTLYGNSGSNLPPAAYDGLDDGKIDTHLINFGPNVNPLDNNTNTLPKWYYESSGGGRMRCAMTCHGHNMRVCGYVHGNGLYFGGQSWCS